MGSESKDLVSTAYSEENSSREEKAEGSSNCSSPCCWSSSTYCSCSYSEGLHYLLTNVIVMPFSSITQSFELDEDSPSRNWKYPFPHFLSIAFIHIFIRKLEFLASLLKPSVFLLITEEPTSLSSLFNSTLNVWRSISHALSYSHERETVPRLVMLPRRSLLRLLSSRERLWLPLPKPPLWHSPQSLRSIFDYLFIYHLFLVACYAALSTGDEGV